MLCVSIDRVAFAGLAARTKQIKPNLQVMSKKRGGRRARGWVKWVAET